MEIIEDNYSKTGTTDKIGTIDIVCSNCKSILRISDDDIKMYSGQKFAKCPLCGSKTHINSNEMQCEECGELFEPEYAIGALGCKFAKCTKCGYDNYIDDGIPLTEANIEYPVHFFHYNGERTFKVSDKEINRQIKQCIKKVKNGDDYAYISGGDTIVFASASYKDDEIAVFVCKGYSESVVAT